MKKRGIETEYVSEYAKELVWDNNMEMLDGSLGHQIMLYNEQKRRIDRLLGKVDVIVTDSPTLLSLMYLKEPSEPFENRVVEEFKQNQNFNLFINRGKEFQQTGRIHTLQECKVIDNKIKQFLKLNDIYFGTYYHSTVNVLVDNIVKNLNNITAKQEVNNKLDSIKRDFIISTEKYMESDGKDFDAQEDMEATANIIAQYLPQYVGCSISKLYDDIKKEMESKSINNTRFPVFNETKNEPDICDD